MLINIDMTKAVRGARPIKNLAIKQHYDNNVYRDVSLDEYAEVWRNWLNYSDTKVIKNLDRFDYADYTQGTSQTFDNFILKHAVDKEIFCLKGDFQYHACLGKHVRFKYVNDYDHLISSIEGRGLHALIISAPFSDYGCVHPEFYDLLNLCEINNFPVCVDLAYWGIAKNIELDLIEKSHNKKPILLLDDVFSELDGLRRKKLTNYIKNKQSILTTTDADLIHKSLDMGNIIAF
jgi:hypothetical protein